MLLSIKNIKVQYDKAEVIKGISMDVEEGLITGLIGANGAGKSTILKAISGLIPLTSGEIWFQNIRIDKMEIHKIVKLGIVQIPEGRRLFPYMSVMNNLLSGAYLRNDRNDVKKDLDKVFKRFPRLWERRGQQSNTLSGGEQQMLAIGRALMAKPRLLLMDEPSLGLGPLVVEELANTISTICHEDRISVFLVEQNAGLVGKVTDLVNVLELGQITMRGKLKEIMDSDLVRRAFLGK
jgi:branched-chain amino acid transport system ATP-binding protein